MSQLQTRLSNDRWLKQSFMLSDKAISDADMVRRTLTTAAFKFTDTTIGGNFAINTPPQFTRYADIKVGGQPNQVFKRSTGTFERSTDDGAGGQNAYRNATRSRGQGRYYSEAIDDNGQYVTMRFGVPEFNSLLTFFGNFYNAGAAQLARTGRGETLLYTVGKAAGVLLSLPFYPFIVAGRVIRFLSQSPPSKFYYLKPSMPMYWTAANRILNAIAINMGITPQSMAPEQTKIYQNPELYGYNASVAQKYSNWLPDVINKDGLIDLYAVATRAQRLSNRYNEQVRESLFSSSRLAEIRGSANKVRTMEITDGGTYKTLDAYVQAYANLPGNEANKNESGESKEANMEAAGDRSRYDWGSKFSEFFQGERRDGASFVTFRVDFTGQAQESFQNTTREPDIAQKFNSMSSSNRSIRFSIADGNFGDGAITNLVEGTLGMVKDVAVGVADGIGVSGLAALGGSALVDIPKMWDASTANLPRMDFTIQLRSPYGNKLSRLRNLYMPLSMLLAGALPLSTGRHSYTSPFICEAYCRGRASIRLGMIESLTVTRGVGNVGWTQDDEPLGIDVTMTIVDMSSILHMPIASNFTALEGAINSVAADSSVGQALTSLVTPSAWDDDNSFTDYMGVLGSLSFQDMVYPTNRWRLNVANQMAEFRSWRSPARWANWFMGTTPGRIVNALSENTDRPR